MRVERLKERKRERCTQHRHKERRNKIILKGRESESEGGRQKNNQRSEIDRQREETEVKNRKER